MDWKSGGSERTVEVIASVKAQLNQFCNIAFYTTTPGSRSFARPHNRPTHLLTLAVSPPQPSLSPTRRPPPESPTSASTYYMQLPLLPQSSVSHHCTTNLPLSPSVPPTATLDSLNNTSSPAHSPAPLPATSGSGWIGSGQSLLTLSSLRTSLPAARYRSSGSQPGCRAERGRSEQPRRVAQGQHPERARVCTSGEGSLTDESDVAEPAKVVHLVDAQSSPEGRVWPVGRDPPARIRVSCAPPRNLGQQRPLLPPSPPTLPCRHSPAK